MGPVKFITREEAESIYGPALLSRQIGRRLAREQTKALDATARKGERVKRIMRRGLVSASDAADIAEGVAREAWAGGSPMADLVKAQTAPRAA